MISLTEELQARRRVVLDNPPPEAVPYLLARERLDERLLVVARDEARALELARDITTLGRHRATLFLGSEHLPWDGVAPDPVLVGERLALRHAILGAKRPEVLITTAQTLLERWLPTQAFQDASLRLEVDQFVERQELIAAFIRCGYQRVSFVEDPGTFAVRGGIVDFFPPASADPVRLDFFGDDLESIRPFHVQTQAPGKKFQAATIFPIRDVVYAPERTERAVRYLRALGEELLIPSRKLNAIVDDIQRQDYFFGIESLWPAFYSASEPILEALVDDETLVVLDEFDQIEEVLRDYYERAVAAAEQAREAGEPACAVDDFLIEPTAALSVLRKRASVLSFKLVLGKLASEAQQVSLGNFRALAQEMALRRQDAGRGEIFDPLVSLLQDRFEQDYHVLLTCANRAQAERLRELLIARKIDLPILTEIPRAAIEGDIGSRRYRAIVVSTLSRGFEDEAASLICISDVELFGVVHRRKSQRSRPAPDGLSTLKGLSEGEPVIHVDHGIGRYMGLKRLVLAGVDGDYVHLEYADGDKLYVPIYRLGQIQQYRGPTGNVRLDKLGGTRWVKTRKKVRDAVLQMAHQLLEVQARRQALEGLAVNPPDAHFRAFETAFAFEETPDQRTAIEAVIGDLTSSAPMDRVVCGDVGFGKTEVAIRAAFLTVLSGHQVAVLVPTTVLAEQHGYTFRERLESEGVNVKVVNRFRKPAELKAIIRQVQEGKVDVLIGTHRLLSQDIVYRQLGLLIVDEEHRFGVRHKERIKQLRHQVNVLTLTATPIPRTLHMATTGMRDLSIIQTPPSERVPIRTEVSRFDEGLIKGAIERELHRGGQVFVVHNRVSSIHALAELIEELVPGVRVGIGHGQMSGPDLERVMVDFVQRNYQVLVSTAIIESGIDIPSANTMIVNRADTFGLSQLHQIRGRIGRGRTRAYAYLLLPRNERVTRDATERLAALKRHSSLGAGFEIATRDLEIRGAGDLLGKDQSGNIAAVGFELYTQLLAEAVEAVKGSGKSQEVEPEIKVPVPAVFPESYIEQPMHRLELYQRLSAAETDDAILRIFSEIHGLYGHPPDEVGHLSEVMLMRLRLMQAGASALSVGFGEDEVRLGVTLLPESRVNRAALVELVQRDPKRFGVTASGRLTLRAAAPRSAAPRELLRIAREALGHLPF